MRTPRFRQRLRHDVPAITLVGVLALLALVGAVVVVVCDRDGAPSDPGSELWRALPQAADLPPGWSARGGYITPDLSTGISLRGPERLIGFVSLTPHDHGEAGARTYLSVLRESAVALGKTVVEVPRIGDETVAIREGFGPLIGGDEGSIMTERLVIVWRRGAVVASVSVDDTPIGLGPDGQRPRPEPVESDPVVAIAERVDEKLSRISR